MKKCKTLVNNNILNNIRSGKRVIILGDLIIDRSFYIKRETGPEYSTYEGRRWGKERLQISLGGSATLASLISNYCPVTFIYLDAYQGELTSLTREKIESLRQLQPKLRLRPISAPSRRVCEITRVIKERSEGEDYIEVRFEECEESPISANELKDVDSILNDEKEASIYLLVDFDRGFITSGLTQLLQKFLLKNNKVLIVQPYLDWVKYKSIPIHSVSCREEHLKVVMHKEFNGESSINKLPNELKFFMTFPQCQNLFIHNYSKRNLVFYFNKNEKTCDIKVITYRYVLPVRRLIQTRTIATAYYTLAIYFGLNVEEAATVAAWACDVGKNTKFSVLPNIDGLIGMSRSRRITIEIKTQFFNYEFIIINKIIKEGKKISLKKAQTVIPGYYTQNGKYQLEIKKIEDVLFRHKNQAEKPVRSVLIYGDSSSGKGYFAECIGKFLVDKESRRPMETIRCDQYGLGKGVRSVEEIIQKIEQYENGTLLLDEVDKFKGSIKDCQDLFLEFLEKSIINRKFIDVFIIATASTNWETDTEQRPDFFKRFYVKLHVPSIDERICDIPFVLANHFIKKGVKGITLGALVAFMQYKHENFRTLKHHMEVIETNIKQSNIICSTHLPLDYKCQFDDTIEIEFENQ